MAKSVLVMGKDDGRSRGNDKRKREIIKKEKKKNKNKKKEKAKSEAKSALAWDPFEGKKEGKLMPNLGGGGKREKPEKEDHAFSPPPSTSLPGLALFLSF